MQRIFFIQNPPLNPLTFFQSLLHHLLSVSSVLTILLKIATPLFTLLHFFCFSTVPFYMYNYLFYLLFIHCLSLLEYKILEIAHEEIEREL